MSFFLFLWRQKVFATQSYESIVQYEGLPGKIVAQELPLSVVSEVRLIDPSDG